MRTLVVTALLISAKILPNEFSNKRTSTSCLGAFTQTQRHSNNHKMDRNKLRKINEKLTGYENNHEFDQDTASL